MMCSWKRNRFVSGRTVVILEAGVMIVTKQRYSVFLQCRWAGEQPRTSFSSSLEGCAGMWSRRPGRRWQSSLSVEQKKLPCPFCDWHYWQWRRRKAGSVDDVSVSYHFPTCGHKDFYVFIGSLSVSPVRAVSMPFACIGESLPLFKILETSGMTKWMDSGTGGLSLMESLCPFFSKENEDSIVVNILRLQQGTEKERVRTQYAAFYAGLWSCPALLPSSLLLSRHYRCPGVGRTVINGIVQLKDSSWHVTKSLSK